MARTKRDRPVVKRPRTATTRIEFCKAELRRADQRGYSAAYREYLRRCVDADASEQEKP